MASVDESVRMSSDERFEYECTLCKEDNAMREAKHYCPECSEYYCDSCETFHRRLKATKSHEVLHGDEIAHSTSQRKVILSIMYCNCIKTRLVQLICEEHAVAVCTECKEIHHRKCKTSSLQEKGKTFSERNITATSDRMKAIASKVDHLQEQQNVSIESFSKMKNACKEEIESLRQKLRSFVDDIADASLRDLETCALTHSHDNDDILTTTASTKMRLQDEVKLLEDASATADGCQMLVADMIAKQKCDDFQNIIAAIEKDFSPLEVSFYYDKTITALTDKTTKLGNILVNRRTGTCLFPKSLVSMTFVEDKAASFSPRDAERITGSAFMPSGDLLICSQTSKTVSLFDQNFKEVSSCQLSEKPWNVVSVTDTTALVSQPYVMKLQFIETKPTIKSNKCITLDKMCFGIAATDGEIFVSCSNDPGKGEIRILDMAGNIKRKLGVSKDGKPMLNTPAYLSLHEKDKVVVSEYHDGEIVCQMNDGKTPYKYDLSGCGLRGMIMDRDDNICVCDESKNCIHVITDGGTKHKTFLEMPDKDAKPTSISFRASDSTLIVSCNTKVYVYKVKK